jgi:hypothetical protein
MAPSPEWQRPEASAYLGNMNGLLDLAAKTRFVVARAWIEVNINAYEAGDDEKQTNDSDGVFTKTHKTILLKNN